MSIAERFTVQTIDGSEESMLDSIGGLHDGLPFRTPLIRNGESPENLTGVDKKK
jgi:hypothetical protein